MKPVRGAGYKAVCGKDLSAVEQADSRGIALSPFWVPRPSRGCSSRPNLQPWPDHQQAVHPGGACRGSRIRF